MTKEQIQKIVDKYNSCFYNVEENKIECADSKERDAIQKELGLDNSHVGGSEVDGYYIWDVLKEEVEAPKYADDLEIEIANKLEKAFPQSKGVHDNATNIVMDIVDYYQTYYDEGKTQDEIRAKLIARLPDYGVTHMGMAGRIIDLVIKEFGIDKWDWSEGHPTESLKEEKENSLFRVTLVMWRDARNSDTDYLEDFKTKEEAIKYIEENSDKILEDEKKTGLEDLEELDLDVEEWVGDDIKGVVYSTRIWSKLPESLTEAEEDELSDDELDALDAEEEKAFKQKQADRRARVAGKRKEKSDKEAKLVELKKKLGSEYDFDKLFDTLVPPTGKADTVAGEVIRALNKVDYRDFNDGDVFYEEDGLDTCGGAMAFVAEFFLDKFNDSDDTDSAAEGIYNEIINMAEDRLTDSAYRTQLYDLEKQVVAWIKAHEDTLVEPNDKDCLTSFKGEEYWEDYIPSYDIEDIELPMNVKDLLELGEIDGDDIVWAVQDIIQGMGNSTDDVRYEGDYISVYGLSKADFDECGGDQGGNLYDWIEDWARNEYDDPDEIRARQEEEERQQYADDEESEEDSEEETDESLTEYASLEDRKPNKIFVEGDRVKYVNNDGWTEGGERNIGETGVIVDRIYQGNLEIFTVKRDVPKEYKGYEDTAFLATKDNLEFVEETDEGLKESNEEKAFNVTFHDGPNSSRQERVIIKAKDLDDASSKAYAMPQAKQYDNVTIGERAEGLTPYMVAFKYNYVFKGKVDNSTGEGYLAFNAENESQAKQAYNKKFLNKYFKWVSPGKDNVQPEPPTDMQGGKYGKAFDVYQIGSQPLTNADDAKEIIDNKASESYNDKELKEDASVDLYTKLEPLYNEGNIWFDIVEKQNGGNFIIFEDWKSLIAVEKALKPEFEPKDEYDTSVLDELDIDYGFSDEWGRCDNCGKLIRLEADSAHWVPDFFWNDNGIVCGNCVRQNPEEYIAWLLESPAERANTILDNKGLESAGFHKVDGNYENGWYDKHDSPEEILNKAYEEHPEAEFIFSISGVGKFAVQFELWMRGE